MKRCLLGKTWLPLVLAALVTPRLAVAEEPEHGEAGEIARARRLFSEAIVLEDAKAWGAAAEKLRQALLIKETPGLRYHLAHCEEQMGSLVAASLNYERASALLREGAKAPDVEQLLGLASQRIAARVPKLTLLVSAGAPDVQVSLDGKPVDPAALGQVTLVDPGTHRVAASAPGYHDFATEFAMNTGDAKTVEIALVPLAPSAPTETASPPADSGAPGSKRNADFGAREITLVAEAAITLAGLGVGIGYAVARENAEADVHRIQDQFNQNHTNDPYVCASAPTLPECMELADAIERHDAAATLSTAGFVGAGVGAAAFVLTWVLWPSSRETTAFHIAPRGAGLDVRAVTRF